MSQENYKSDYLKNEISHIVKNYGYKLSNDQVQYITNKYNDMDSIVVSKIFSYLKKNRLN